MGGGNPVYGATVLFQSVVGRAASGTPVIAIGDTNIHRNPVPVILSSSQINVLSDANGLAGAKLTSGSFPGPLIIQGSAAVGTASLPFLAQSVGQ